MQYEQCPPPQQYIVWGDAKFPDSISMAGGVCWKAVAAFLLRVTIWMSGSHNPLWCKMAILMFFRSGYVPEGNLVENSLYTALCVVPHKTKLSDLLLQICSDIWVVYPKEMFCVWTADILKKSCPNPFSCTWCWRPQITIWSACVLCYIARVCYKHSIHSCLGIPQTPYSFCLQLFATCQVLCSDTPHCYNYAVVSSGILDSHRHGKSQVVPLLHSYSWHFTQ